MARHGIDEQREPGQHGATDQGQPGGQRIVAPFRGIGRGLASGRGFTQAIRPYFVASLWSA